MDRKMTAIATSMLLLKLISEGDTYGYQMIQELKKRSEHVFDMKEGTIYPVLHSLEKEGNIYSYEGLSETGRKRKYYRITDEGRIELERKLAEWDVYRNAIGKILEGI